MTREGLTVPKPVEKQSSVGGAIWGFFNGLVSGAVAGAAKVARGLFGPLESAYNDSRNVMYGDLSPLDIWKINRAPTFNVTGEGASERDKMRDKLLAEGRNRPTWQKALLKIPIVSSVAWALSVAASGLAAAYNVVSGIGTAAVGSIRGAKLGYDYGVTGATGVGVTGIYKVLTRPGFEEARESVLGKLIEPPKPKEQAENASEAAQGAETTAPARTVNPILQTKATAVMANSAATSHSASTMPVSSHAATAKPQSMLTAATVASSAAASKPPVASPVIRVYNQRFAQNPHSPGSSELAKIQGLTINPVSNTNPYFQMNHSNLSTLLSAIKHLDPDKGKLVLEVPENYHNNARETEHQVNSLLANMDRADIEKIKTVKIGPNKEFSIGADPRLPAIPILIEKKPAADLAATPPPSNANPIKHGQH